MVLDEDELLRVGMSLLPDVRWRVALRLLDTVDLDAAFAFRTERWLRTEVAPAYDEPRPPPS